MVSDRREVAAFLRSRRALIKPGDVGFPAGGARRVPGLRREELAIVAGISPDHYQRIEQGRSRPSAATLDAIADALRLSPDERHYLRRLVDAESGAARPPRTERPVPRHVRSIVESAPAPAYLLNHRRDILAWSPSTATLVCDFAKLPIGDRNLAWLMFTDSRMREIYPDWAETARNITRTLRYAEGEHPDDERLAALIARLDAASPEFRRLRAMREVAQKCGGRKRLVHPLVGELDFAHQSFAVNGHPGLEMLMYSPADEATADALEIAASLAASPTR